MISARPASFWAQRRGFLARPRSEVGAARFPRMLEAKILEFLPVRAASCSEAASFVRGSWHGLLFQETIKSRQTGTNFARAKSSISTANFRRGFRVDPFRSHDLAAIHYFDSPARPHILAKPLLARCSALSCETNSGA